MSKSSWDHEAINIRRLELLLPIVPMIQCWHRAEVAKVMQIRALSI